jgi:CRP-like cAMP-binding protein
MGTAQQLDKRAILADHFLLRHLPADTLDALARFARVQDFRRNETIVRKGDPGTGMMAVISGRVKISTVSLEGKEIIIDFINPGELFGEIALIDSGERTADAVAIAATRLMVLERRDFLPFLERHPGVCIKLLSLLCARLRQTTGLVEDALFQTVEYRLAKRLLRFAAQFGEPHEDGVLLPLQLSQREIAALIGVTRETVNKQLGNWQDRGWVEIRRGALFVRDIDALEGLVDLSL